MGVVLRKESGFSLLEVLFASVILLAALLGVAALFMRSMANNVEGRESSQVSNLTRAVTEEMQGLDLEQPNFQVNSGESIKMDERYWDESTSTWSATPVTGSRWTSRREVLLFSLNDIKDDPPGELPMLNNPLDGSASDEYVNMRGITVQIIGQRETGALGSRRELEVHTVRGF